MGFEINIQADVALKISQKQQDYRISPIMGVAEQTPLSSYFSGCFLNEFQRGHMIVSHKAHASYYPSARIPRNYERQK
jgi:hypothetical protein